ncbi:ABC transporter ATP-binding protein [Nocardioides sp. R1-1]|uniref:ABC transporter ATP-binding protein n=1 Tax=Nocardioides sp. R1-1 TaxID=3383502 RepID=UPI0038D019DB
MRRIGMVFQDSDLLPELTVVENAELPGRLLGREAREYRARARETLSEVGLESRRDSWPSDLSGGERQRVAVARALHHRPGLLLADEPTGALDQDNRDRVVALIVDIARSTGAVALIATHDPRDEFAGLFPWEALASSVIGVVALALIGAAAVAVGTNKVTAVTDRSDGGPPARG